METINKISSSASNAIFGSQEKPAESGLEPVSGQQGTGTAEEPYDAGNRDAGDMSRSGVEPAETDNADDSVNNQFSRDENPVSSSLPSAIPASSESQDPNDTNTNTNTNDDTANTTTTNEESTYSSQPREPSSSDVPSSDPNTIGRESQGLTTGGGMTGINTAGDPSHLSEADTLPTGSNPLSTGAPHGTVERPTEANQPHLGVHAGGFGTAEPSVSAAPDSGAQPRQKHQGGDRPTEEPTGDEAAEEAVRRKKQMAEESMTKEGGGDQLQQQQQPVGGQMNGGLGKPPPDESKIEEKGTGQKHVKSTGVAAQGGDFDATKPGAGREADRLLEEQGINRDHTDTSRTSIAAAAHASGEGKRSVGDKIKEKLHMGSH